MFHDVFGFYLRRQPSVLAIDQFTELQPATMNDLSGKDRNKWHEFRYIALKAQPWPTGSIQAREAHVRRNSRRRVNPFLICLLGLMCGIASAAVLPADAPVAQLKPGKVAGTFHFVRHSEAILTMDEKRELVASVTDGWRDVAASVPIKDPHNFTIEADLRPGTYSISVSPADESNSDYWPSNLALRIHIDKDGGLYFPDYEHSFVLLKQISGFSPGDMATADRTQPTLSWPAVPGASYYEGAVFVNGPVQRIHQKDPKILLSRNLLPDQKCIWSIRALDRNGDALAEGRGIFFGQGTKAAIIERARANQKCTITRPPAGGSFLGIRPVPAWADKRPTRTPPGGGFSIPPGSNTDFIPGIEVWDIAPASPAIDAGLLPGDVIVAMNDHPVPVDPNENIPDVQAFIQQISALAPGSQVKLKVRRFPEELIVTATLGRFGGTKPKAPATAPAGG